MTTKNSSKNSKGYDMPGKQRALVLQGGGALGAYEVGVLKVLCRKLIESSGNEGKDKPLFDIVAGSSMGAMNAADTRKQCSQYAQDLGTSSRSARRFLDE